jgi:hypothetical protein
MVESTVPVDLYFISRKSDASRYVTVGSTRAIASVVTINCLYFTLDRSVNSASAAYA